MCIYVYDLLLWFYAYMCLCLLLNSFVFTLKASRVEEARVPYVACEVMMEGKTPVNLLARVSYVVCEVMMEGKTPVDYGVPAS